MGQRILVTAVRTQEPDIRLYVLALIALARQLEEEEEASRKSSGKASGGEQ